MQNASVNLGTNGKKKDERARGRGVENVGGFVWENRN